jgi:hypothetical protein
MVSGRAAPLILQTHYLNRVTIRQLATGPSAA